jgi:release factor glutamine methyltransferase
VLIPRPDTEILVEEALRHADNIAGEIKILDCGTGSGCIAVTLASELISRGRVVSVLAIDKSKDALAIAAQNAFDLGVAQYIELRESDWFSAIGPEEHFNLIVANPPYIGKHEKNLSYGLVFEPSQALFSPDAGYADLRSIISTALLRERPPEVLLLECGSTQARVLADWIRACGDFHALRRLQVAVCCDLGGFDRVVSISATL